MSKKPDYPVYSKDPVPGDMLLEAQFIVSNVIDAAWDDKSPMGWAEVAIVKALLPYHSVEVERDIIIAVADAMEKGKWMDRYGEKRIRQAFARLVRNKYLYSTSNQHGLRCYAYNFTSD